jgi:hypothetical protein
MDQVKEIFAKMMVHRFWIITTLSVIMASVAWFMTSSNLSGEFDKNAKAIKDSYSQMTSVSGLASKHPNKDSQEQMNRIINSLATDVNAAWDAQYKRQEMYLQWREEAIKLPSLINKLKKFYPVELKLNYPEEPKTVSVNEKQRFAKYFAEQMPELAKIIGVTWVGEVSKATSGYGSSMTGSGGGDAGAPGGYPGGMLDSTIGPASKDVIIWPKSSQSNLLTSLQMWKGDTPTVYQMMYTQENMWILEGLFNIIAKTNVIPGTDRPAIANFQASIKAIDFIRIGKDAVGDAGVISGFGGSGLVGMDGSAGMGMGMGSGMGSGGMSGGMSGGSGGGSVGSTGDSSSSGSTIASSGTDGSGMTATPMDPADKRYVDANFQPITGDDLRSRINSQAPEHAYFAVAKRVPVRMKFKIEESRIPEFLANCGNEGLMLEVRQVRIGKFQSKSAAGGSDGMGGGAKGGMGMGGMDMTGSGGMGGDESADFEDDGGAGGVGSTGGMGSGGVGSTGGMGTTGGMGSGGMGSGGMGSGGMGSGGMGGMGGGGVGMDGSMPRPRKKTTEIPIEVYGVVYLFNPANTERLGLNKVTEVTKVEEPVPSEPVPSAPASENPPVPPAATTTEPQDGAALPSGDVPAAGSN